MKESREPKENNDHLRHQYARKVLELYRQTPGVLGRVRRADRDLASSLFDQKVPLFVIHNALIVAAARRAQNNAFSTPSPPVYSLHYFLPVIKELIERPLGHRDILKMASKLNLMIPL